MAKAIKKNKKKPQGRPTTYTVKKADSICAIIATSSKSFKTICEELKIPTGSALAWLSREKTFQERYARAKEMQADYLAEEMLDIADDGSNDLMTITKGDITYNVENKEVTNRSRLRVDTRKWIASKLKPKRYGEKITQEISGIDGEPIDLKIGYGKPQD